MTFFVFLTVPSGKDTDVKIKLLKWHKNSVYLHCFIF